MTIHEQANEALERYFVRHGVENKNRLMKAAFFDMDGVLFDSMPAHARAWQETAAHWGLRMSEYDCYMFEGQTGLYTINLLYQREHGRDATEDERKQIYLMKTELFTRYNSRGCIPYAREVISALSALTLVLVTGSSQPSLLERIEHDYPQAFLQEFIVTGLDVRKGKPDPEPYLMAQKKAGVKPYEAFVVENAPRGVRSAHEAGCFTIAVNTGPLNDEELWREGADLVLPDMKTLLELIPSLPLGQ